MRCNWQAYLNLVPPAYRREVDMLGRENLQELRLRLNRAPELLMQGGSRSLTRPVQPEDLQYCVSAASRYSPWAAATVSRGYLTGPGGHRLGLCGEAAVKDGQVQSIRNLTSVNLRAAREFPGIANRFRDLRGSVLIIGRPGSGKTTLLRDYIRVCSDVLGETVCVVDERMELFPPGNGFETGAHTDVLSGWNKAEGTEAAIRNMNPDTVAVDEITAETDCRALLYGGWCGVRLVATAHASSRQELLTRPVYRPLAESGLFEHLIVLGRDKTGSRETL